MSSAKQSVADREKRLSECRCPVHGAHMVQVGHYGQQFLAECPRRDCDIRGTTSTLGGAVALLPNFRHLLIEGKMD